MRKIILFTFLLFAGFAAGAQVIMSESFNVTTATATLPTGWTVSSTGTTTGCNGIAWMQVPSGGFICTVNGTPSPRPTAQSGSGMAGYNSWDIDLGGISIMNSAALNFSTPGATYVVSFWVFNQNTSISNAHDSLKVYVNNTPGIAGGTLLYANDPNFNTSPAGWAQYSYTIPSSFNGPTNYIVFWAKSNWGQDIFIDDVVVRTQAPPPPTVTTNSPLCPGSTLTITATVAAGYPSPTYSLTGPGISPQNNTTGIFSIPNITNANAGTYNVVVSSGGYTSAATSTTVNVFTTPTSITASNVTIPSTCVATDGSFQICGMDPLTNYTLNFRKDNVAQPARSITTDASGCYTVTGIGVGAYDNIRVTTAAPNNCNSNMITSPIIVPAPTPPPTPQPDYSPKPLCPGSTLTLSVKNVAASSTYKWVGPGGFAPATNSTGTITRSSVTQAMAGIYTVTVTTAAGCSAQDTITVNVKSPDPQPFGNNVTYCQYDVAIPLSVGGIPNAIFTWYPGPVGGTGSPTAPTPSTLVPTPFPTNMLFYVSQTSPGGCESPRDTVYVIVKPRPNVPTVADSTIEYCQYEVVGPLSANGASIRWFTTLTGGTGSATAPTPSTLIPGTYFFYASQTVDGCESERKTIRVIVKPKPAPPGVTSPLNICQGEPVAPLTAIGQNLLWYTIPAGGVGVPVAPLPNTGYEDSFEYYVTQTVNGCESDRALISVFIRYRPNGIITAATQTVCQDESNTFFYYGNARPDAEYVWFAPLSASFVSGQGTPGPVVIHFDTAGTSVVQLIINNKGCISRLVAAPITVRPLPKVSFVNRQDVCEDELVNVALNGIEPDISGYNWNFGSDDIILEYGVVTTGGPFGVRYPRQGHYQISVTAEKNFCRSKPIYQEVYVHPKPDAHISYSSDQNPADFCSSDTLHLSVQRVEEGGTYTWTPAAFFQGYEDTLNYLVSAVVSHTSTIKVNVKTAFGCEATDSLKVTTKPCCEVYFPNAFTPNKDGRNDVFKPITLGIHKINTYRIMNRWGQVVFETKIEREGWDGTYNGVPQDMGTYYYYVNYKCDGKNVEDRGEFLLMR